MQAEYIFRHHRHQPKENQCSSSVVKQIKAPADIVWSLVRRFDQPQKYKPLVSRCTVQGDLKIGSVRQVNVKTGLPATTNTERLELLDDQEQNLGVKFVGGDHRLKIASLGEGIFRSSTSEQASNIFETPSLNIAGSASELYPCNANSGGRKQTFRNERLLLELQQKPMVEVARRLQPFEWKQRWYGMRMTNSLIR